MSGRTKRIIYQVVDLILWIGALAGVLLLLLLTVPSVTVWEYVACGGLIVCILLRIPALVHECGHLLFGALSGMKVNAVLLSFVRFSRGSKPKIVGPSNADGETELFPADGKNVRTKLIVSALGGGIMNLIFGGVLLALYLALPYNCGLLFAAMLSLFNLHDGLRALYPASLPAGSTDGGFALGLIKKKPEEEVALRVAQAQGILFSGSFSDIPKELFTVPVVREDLPARHALLLLQGQYLLSAGDSEGARAALERLLSLEEYLTAETKAEAGRYLSYLNGEPFVPAENLFRGISELERSLAQQKE